MLVGKKLLVVAASLMVASGAMAVEKPVVNPGPAENLGGGLLDCTGASGITCGETQTNAAGPGAGNVTTYGCTTLSYDSAVEFVYELCIGDGGGDVSLTMTYAHNGTTNDLDLFLLSACDEAQCLDSSLGTSGTETIDANLAAGTYYVVVDGWGGRQDGSPHTLTVECSAPCDATPIEERSWGAIKGGYSN